MGFDFECGTILWVMEIASFFFTANADRLMDMDMGNCLGHVHNEQNHDANG